MAARTRAAANMAAAATRAASSKEQQLVLSTTLASGIEEFVKSSDGRMASKSEEMSRSDITVLWMELTKSTSTIESDAQQRRALCAVMKQRFEHFEEYFAPAPVTPLVSQPKPSARLPSACAESPPECAFVTNGNEAMHPSNTESTCATAVKAVQQVIAKPAVVESKSGNSGEPTLVSCNTVNATGFTSIFVGVIPKAVTDVQLQVMLDTKTHIGRYHGKSKFGHAKILIPNGDVDRVLKLDLSVSGHKLRIKMAEF